MSGAATASFVYDGDGRRVKATVNGVTSYTIGDHYGVSGGVVKKYYTAGGQRIALRNGGTIRWLLLKYMCRIWDESIKQNPGQSELPPILPVVFYQGERAWRHSTEFIDLFPEGERGHGFLPRFAHYLIDQSGLAPEAVKGGLKAKVAQ